MSPSLSKAHKIISRAVPSPSAVASLHKSVPTPVNVVPSGANWSGYWMAVTGMALVLFVLYIAANGQLQTWLNLFVYSAPSTVQPSGASPSTSSSVPPSSNSASTAGNLGASVDNAIGLPSGTSAAIDSAIKPYAASIGLGGLFQ